MKKQVRNSLRSIKHLLENKAKFYRRIGLRNRTFSIVSNNCAGGYIYQYFGIPYRTPTAGILFETDDFLKICRNPKKYFTTDIEFINPSSSKNLNKMKKTNRWGTYPIGKIDDIEIYFMHYENNDEALKKWNRRCERIDFDNIIFMLTENETCTEEKIRDFCEIPLKNKLCFTFQNYNIEETVYSKEVEQLEGHPWKPEIVQCLINWKCYLNQIGQ